MADRDETEAPLAEPVATPSDAGAVALALAHKGRGGKTDEKLDAFLDEQTRFVRLQADGFHEQQALQLEHLRQQDKHHRLRYFGDRLRIGLQLLAILFGLSVAVVFGAMAWQAHEDHGVSIAAFSVPPDLVQRGLTGQVIASRLLDRLADLQAQTVTARPASTYANDWGGDIKVEIPETGVSIGELNGYLRQWLGHETRISGEVVRTPTGLSVTARAGSESGKTFQGADADLDRLVEQSAEALYAQTQPYRYAVWLSGHGRRADGYAAFARLARSGAPDDRAWAYAGWASMLTQDNRYAEAARMARAAIRLNPRLEPANLLLGASLDAIDQGEAALAAVRGEIALLKSGRAIGLPRPAARNQLRLMQSAEAYEVGDFARSAALAAALDPIDFEGQAQAYPPDSLNAMSLAFDHDVTASRRVTSRFKAPPGRIAFLQGAALDEWLALAPSVDAAVASVPPGDQQRTALLPDAATLHAHIGPVPEAEALISRTPMDCEYCLRRRGLVAAVKRDWPAADRWYAEAARLGPSLPFAHTEWGQALLAKGDLDGAIDKLKEAHRRSPHFADPLELWGEALMRRGDVAGAVKKFKAADKEAPRWGRNHLRWGQALARLGKADEAKAQWRAAAGMDLSAADRAELTKVQEHG